MRVASPHKAVTLNPNRSLAQCQFSPHSIIGVLEPECRKRWVLLCLAKLRALFPIALAPLDHNGVMFSLRGLVTTYAGCGVHDYGSLRRRATFFTTSFNGTTRLTQRCYICSQPHPCVAAT